MKNYLNYNLSKKFAEFLDAKELEFESDVNLFITENNLLVNNFVRFDFEQSYTFDDIIDFFIEKFNVHIEVGYSYVECFYNLFCFNGDKIFVDNIFETRKEAIEYGIEKVIEILTEKE
jgi:hypothetical protein